MLFLRVFRLGVECTLSSWVLNGGPTGRVHPIGLHDSSVVYRKPSSRGSGARGQGSGPTGVVDGGHLYGAGGEGGRRPEPIPLQGGHRGEEVVLVPAVLIKQTGATRYCNR